MRDFRVKIYGARTLERYTKHVIVAGLERNGCTVLGEWDARGDAEHILFQLHGAPQAADDDEEIIGGIKRSLAEKSDVRRIVVLHRPDELKKYGDLPNVLAGAAQKIGLVFLGDKFIDDPFYPASERIVKRVIPHGFFPMEDYQKRFQLNPIVIGSHTTWGEMRSVEHALELLLNIFKLNGDGERTILGYLGGRPRGELRLGAVREAVERLGSGSAVQVVNVHDYSGLEDIAVADRGHVVLVDDRDEAPTYFSLTYNIQLYYLGSTVRVGESSGSVHTTIAIPVILEMNGSENIEGLEVIKVPYADAESIGSVDFEAGARRVLASIESGRYEKMLARNLQQSEIWNSARIGEEYVKLFEELKAGHTLHHLVDER